MLAYSKPLSIRVFIFSTIAIIDSHAWISKADRNESEVEARTSSVLILLEYSFISLYISSMKAEQGFSIILSL